MAERATIGGRVRAGLFEIDIASGELYKSGRKVALQEQPFRILTILLQRPGELVTRQDLQNRLWPGDTYVGFDEGLNVAIRKLRAAFSDSAENPRFIETIPRRGYRFIAPITRLDAPTIVSSAEPAAIPVQIESLPTSHAAGRSWISRLAAMGLLIFISVGVVWFWGRRDRAGSSAGLRPNDDTGSQVSPSKLLLSPLMGVAGEQRMPAISPDGSRIAFLLQTTEPKKSGIYVMVAESSTLLQLSTNGSDSDPAWSPDGRFIAFLRTTGDTFSIWMVSTLGGQERRIYSGARCPWEGPVSISFSPDGQQLAFGEWSAETKRNSIRVISLADSSVRTLTTPPSGYNDSAPAFSPKGNWLAFIRWTGPIFVDDLFVIPASGGEPRQITFDHRRIFSAAAWTADERTILFSSARAGMKSLWRIGLAGGQAKPITGPGPNADHPSVSFGGQLAYQYDVEDENLWRVDLGNGRPTEPRPLLSSKTSNLMPDFSPDGRKIAFESDRSGYEEIWTCDAEGSNLAQVTRLERYAGSPRWSPDGRYIAFDFRSQQHSEIYVVEVAVGTPRALVTFADADSVVPSWSRDGRWIYFASNHGGETLRLWKAPLDGGAPVQVTKHDGFRASELADGTILYTRFSQPGIMKLASNAEKLFWKGPGPDNWANWSPSGNGVFFIDSDSRDSPSIRFLNLKTRQLNSILKLRKPSFYGLTVAADQKALVYSQHDRTEHDIVLLRNF